MLVLGWCAGGVALALDPQRPADPEATVRVFPGAIPSQKVEDLRRLLADTKTCHITQETDPERLGIWVETWEEWLRWLVSVDQCVHTVEKLTVTKTTPDLATVALTAHTCVP